MAKGEVQLDVFVPYRLSIAANAVSDLIAGAYRSLFGLSVPEWRAICVLAEQDFVSQAGVGARTRMDKVTVSRAVGNLLKRDLVRRAANPHDRRSQLLVLSRDGRRLYGQIAPVALSLEAAVLDEFSPDEVRVLMSMLSRLEAAADRLEAKGATPPEAAAN